MNEAEKLINRLYGNIGFTCDVCGRKVNGCHYINGMSFCEKCYQETFGKDNQQNEIQQLKQQLEEKDKEINSLIIDYEKRISQEQELMSNLEKQLAEKDIRIEELEGQFAYECECNMQLVDLQKQLEEKQNTIDEINKEFVQAVHDWKALCAEKDKEIAYMTKQAKKFNNEAQKYYEDAYCNSFQNQKVIAELEKVKDWLNEPFDEDGCFKIGGDLIDFIDQQIKELRRE